MTFVHINIFAEGNDKSSGTDICQSSADDESYVSANEEI